MVKERESITAKLCAFARAWHSYNSREKIYDDYLAFDFMGKEEYEELYEMISDGLIDTGDDEELEPEDIVKDYLAPIPLSRLHFNEKGLEEFARENEDIQYVICGAGEDTFAFRNENESIEIFEVDHPDTQRFKLERIRDLEWIMRPNVHYVPVDFEKERMLDKLLEAGFDPNKKTYFSILGVSYYLTLDVFSETLRQIAELSQPGSRVVFDYPHSAGDFPERVERLEELTRALGEVMCGGFDPYEVKCILCSLGFRLDKILTPEKVQEKYFDGRSDGLKAFENVSLVSATFVDGYRQNL
ncbi:MAG: class I SAM-dependent methyltransferase [Eubacterium sp.]|nr:class I SAM-dependent methyltransferase [Eubacterium sp.]